MSDQVAEYAERIPAEVRLALDGLTGRTDNGYAVVMLLLEADEPMRFGEIREELGLHQQTLTDTLEDLQVGGVVQRRPDADPGGYSLSTFGRRILDGLYEASLDPVEAPMAESVPSGGRKPQVSLEMKANAGGGQDSTDDDELSVIRVPTSQPAEKNETTNTSEDMTLASPNVSEGSNDDEFGEGDSVDASNALTVPGA